MGWLVILAVVLACPLMHFWMMRKGGHEHGNHKKETKKEVGSLGLKTEDETLTGGN